MLQNEIKYGFFREDSPQMNGFSKELISHDFAKFLNESNTYDTLNSWPFEGVDTLYKALQRNLQQIPNSPLFGTKVGNQYEWLTFQDVFQQAQIIASGLMTLNLVPEVMHYENRPWRFIGIKSKNRKEWYLTHIANMLIGVTTVAMYDSLTPDAEKFIINQTQLTSMLTTSELVKSIINLKIQDNSDEAQNQKMQSLKNIIIIDGVNQVTQEILELADKAGITLKPFDEILEQGQKSLGDLKIIEPKKEDTYMLSYTSGTTGDPKGVKLQHQMVVQTAASVNQRLQPQCLCETDTYISYLPAAHSFEQALFGTSIIYGMRCGFYGGDPLKMVEQDLPLLKPTFFPSVPRLYNRIYGKIKDVFASKTCFAKWLVDTAVQTKTQNLLQNGTFTHGFFDLLVFKKVKALLGGNVRLMLTGSAPISKEVLDFLQICFCCNFIEGYGMTETCAGSCTTLPGDSESGHVGGPVANVKIRLRDIPEMGYLSTSDPPRGEICFWGPSIMKGYFQNEEKTQEAFYNGWLLSGDVGQVLPNGSIKIIDRAKNIFKLCQGEYIAPEKLENIFVQSEWVVQNWVYGDSLKDYCVIFIVLDPEKAKAWGLKNNVDIANKEFLKSDDLRDLVYSDLMRLANENKLNSLEKPKQMTLLIDPFTIESELLTPTFKLKRNVAKKQFQNEIDLMYSQPPLQHKK